MADGRTLEVFLRLERLDDLFVAPTTLPWSTRYADHSTVPALDHIADLMVSTPGCRDVPATFELPPDVVDDRSADDVRAAIGRWSSARVAQYDRSARTAARRGIRFLLAGVVFFAVGIALSRLIGSLDDELADTLSRGFEVFAWVVLWFPLDLLVFGVWQHRLDRRAATAIGRMPISIVGSDET